MIARLMQMLAMLGATGTAWAFHVPAHPTPEGGYVVGGTVPEPATLGLIAAGAAAVGLLRRRRR